MDTTDPKNYGITLEMKHSKFAKHYLATWGKILEGNYKRIMIYPDEIIDVSGKMPSAETMRSVYWEADINEDGRVDDIEWELYSGDISRGLAEADANGDGELSREEVESLR